MKLIKMTTVAAATTALLAVGVLVPFGIAKIPDAASPGVANQEHSATTHNSQDKLGTRLEFRNNTTRYGGTATTFEVFDGNNWKATLAPGQSYSITGNNFWTDDVETYIKVGGQRKMSITADNPPTRTPKIRCNWMTPINPKTDGFTLKEGENATHADDATSWWVCRTHDSDYKNMVIELWRIPTMNY